MSSSQASSSQITTLSQPLGSKAYKPWQKEEVERLVGWVEEHVDLIQGKPSEWTRRAKEEVFSSSLDDHISANKIRDKVRNMRAVYNKAKQMQLQSGWGLTEEDVEQSVHDRLEKICQFFWRLDGIWGQKPNTTPLSPFDSLAPDRKIYVGNLCEDLHAGLSVVVSWIRLSVGNLFIYAKFCTDH